MRRRIIALAALFSLGINTAVMYIPAADAQEAIPPLTVSPSPTPSGLMPTSAPEPTGSLPSPTQIPPPPSDEPSPTAVVPTAAPTLVPTGAPDLTASSSAETEATAPADLDATITPSPTDLITSILNDPPVPLSASLHVRIKMNLLTRTTLQPRESIVVELLNAKGTDYKTRLVRKDGKEVSFAIKQKSIGDKIILIIDPPANFQPGSYTLRVTDILGNTEELEFQWGVLAVNPNKSIYAPGETADLALAVLDEKGMMVCNAQVEVRIDSDSLNIHDVLSTDNGRITVNPECLLHQATSRPDYEAHYKVGAQGSYVLTMKATAKNRTLSIRDSFDVRDSVPFDVERVSATRIYPADRYPVVFNITAQEDFTGTVTETVPSGFQISPHPDSAVVSYSDMHTEEVAVNGGSVLGVSGVSARKPFDGSYPITQNFGEIADDPFIKKEIAESGLKAHDGVDFAIPEGTEIKAMDEGEVVPISEGTATYGKTVVVSHRWGKSYYGHLSTIDVKAGDRVREGQRIGLSGDTGISTGPHLHFGVLPREADMENGYLGKVNPLPYAGMSSDTQVLGSSTSIYTVKKLVWSVNIRKGDKITLGYQYLAPNISPQFYLSGPLQFTTADGVQLFEEARQWQMAIDAVTRQNFYAESLAVSATTQVSYTGTQGNKTTLTFTPDANSSYVIVASWLILNSSASYQTLAKLTRTTGTPKDFNEQIYRPKDPTDYISGGAIGIDTYGASPASQTYAIQWRSNNAAGTARIQEATLIAIKLDAADQYAQAETRTTYNANTTYQTKASLTFTPATAGNYIILASATVDGNSTSYESKAKLTIDGVDNDESIIRPNIATNRFAWAALSSNGFTAASHTINLQYATSNAAATAGIAHARIVALRGDKFSNIYYNSVDTRTTTNQTGYQDKVTVANTPQAADHVVLAFANEDGASASYSTYTDVAEGTTSMVEAVHETHVAAQRYPFFAMYKKAYTASAPNWKIRYHAESGTAGREAGIKDARIAVLELTTPSPVTISGNAYADEASGAWSSCDTGVNNIRLVIDGTVKQTVSCDPANSGFFTFSEYLTGANQSIAIYMNTDGGDEGVIYIKNTDTNTNITSIKLIKNEVRTRTDSSAAVTKTDIATYDRTDDDDIPVTASTTNSITFDNSSSAKNADQGSGNNYITWNHTTGSGQNGILIVSFAGRGGATVTGVTYGPSNRALSYIRADQNSGDARSELWYLVNPESGTNSITVNTNISQTITAAATTWFGVNQTSPIGNTCGNNSNLVGGTSMSCSLTLSSTSEVIVDALASQNSAPTMTVPGTQTIREQLTGWANQIGVSSQTNATGSTTQTWNSDMTEYWALSAAALEPAAPAVVLVDNTEFHVESNDTFRSVEDLILGTGGNLHVDDGGTLDASTSTSVIIVPGSVTVDTGSSFSSTWGIMTISGNFTNNGTFVPNEGTVAFNDAAQVSTLLYSAATTFYQFTVTTPSKELHFDQTDQTNITNTLNIDGGSCTGLIKLYSNSSPTKFNINATGGTKTVVYADIQDSNAVAAITATNSLNTNTSGSWTITGDACGLSTVNIGGNFYSNETGTAYNCATKNQTITLKVNGGGSHTANCTSSGGGYTVTNVPLHVSGGDIVTVFVSGTTEKAATVLRTVASPATLSNLHLFQNRVYLRVDDAGPITNSDLDFFDSGGNGDVQFTVTGGALTVTAGSKLVINQNDIFTPGGNVTTPSLEVKGTYTGVNETLTLTGSGTSTVCTDAPGTVMPLCSIGLFTADQNYTYFTGTAATYIAGVTYYIMGVGAGADANAVTYTAAGDMVFTNRLVVGNDSSTVNDTFAGSNRTITFNAALWATPLTLTTHGLFQADSSTVRYGASGINVAGTTYNNLDIRSLTTFDGVGYWPILPGKTEAAWDSGATNTGDPFNTAVDTARTQSIILASELRAAGITGGPIYRMTFHISQLAGRAIANFQIGMKNTAATTTTSWEGGFTTVFGPVNFSPLDPGWYYIDLDAPFNWDGVSNLEINMLHNDTGRTNGGGSYKRNSVGTNRNFAGGCNSCAIATATSGTTSGANYDYVPSIGIYSPQTTVLGTDTSQSITVLGDMTVGDGTYPVIVDASSYNPTLDIQNNLNLVQYGSFKASSTGSFKIAGNFANYGGGFDPNGGTVEFYNSSKISTITSTAGSVFYGFLINTASKEVRFDSVDTTYVLPGGSFSVTGQACGTKALLRSASSPTKFNLNVDATATTGIQYADIKDSNAVNALTATNSTNSLNNTGWTITENSCGGAETPTLDKLMRHGKWFDSTGTRKQFEW